MLWKQDDIIKLLADIGTVIVGGAGGDYDLCEMQIPIEGADDRICITPFINPERREPIAESERKLCEVYAVVVFHGDCTGFGSDNEELAVAYGRVIARLTKLGFCVIHHRKLP